MPRKSKAKAKEPKRKAQPKEAKEPKTKIKNIVQNVIVKLDGEKVIRRRRRRVSKPKQAADSVNISASIPPAVIYQTSPAIIQPSSQIIPPKPSMVPAAFDVKVPEKFAAKSEVSFLQDIENEISKPIEIKTKAEQMEDFIAPVDKITAGEFGPTANFISPEQRIKTQETPDRVYTEEPAAFKSEVLGDTYFGEPVLSLKSLTPRSPPFEAPDLETVESPRTKTPHTQRDKLPTKKALYTIVMDKYNLSMNKAKEKVNTDIAKLKNEGITGEDDIKRMIFDNYMGTVA